MDGRDVFPILDRLATTEWSSKKGFIFYSLGLFVLSTLILVSLNSVSLLPSIWWRAAILLGPTIVNAFAWIIVRRLFLSKNLATVVFAINADENSKEYYRDIKKQFRAQIEQFGLSRIVNVKELPTDTNFSSPKEAEAFVEKKQVALLAWGDTTTGTVSGVEHTQFNIRFSYLHGFTEASDKTSFQSEIGTGAFRRAWAISKNDSLVNLIVVSGNIFEISLFILGTTLYSFLNLSLLIKSEEILQTLLRRLENRTEDANFPNLRLVKRKTKNFLIFIYKRLLWYYGYQAQTKDPQKAIDYGEKALRIDSGDFEIHQNIAYQKWLVGDRAGAELHTRTARGLNPGNPLPIFNKGFFLTFDREYSRALREYKKINSVGQTNILDVISFLEDEYTKNPGNPGILFFAGWLNIKFADQMRGHAQIQEFEELVSTDTSFTELTNEAQRVLQTP